MTRGVAVALAALVSWLVALGTGWQPLYQLAIGLAVLVVMCGLWVLNNLWGFGLNRPDPVQTTQVGKLLTDSYILANDSPLPKLDLEIRDHSTLPGHRANAICNVGAKQRVQHTVETVNELHGIFTLGPTSVAAADPFGLFSIERRLTPSSEIMVYPEVVDLGDFAMPRNLITDGTRMRRRTQMQTLDPAGTRPYVYGDSVRRIHWLSSAHAGQLIVKEFEYTPATDIWLFLDMDKSVHVGSGVHSTEEYSVTAAASIAAHFLKMGRDVGLVTSGRQTRIIEPDRGDRQLLGMLELLAMTQANGQLPLRELLWKERVRLNRSASTIVITPSLDERWPNVLSQVSRTRMRTAALLVEGSTFGEAPGATMQVASLSAAHVATYLVKRGKTIEQALGASLGSGRSAAF